MCRTCGGSKHIMSPGMPLEWWKCPACDGNGSRIQFGPEFIVVHKKKKVKK